MARHSMARTTGAAALAILTAVTLAGCSQGTPSTPSPTTSAVSSASSAAPSSSSAAAGTVTCAYPAAGNAAKAVKPPSTSASNTGTVNVTMTTGDGVINMTFDRSGAPCAVNSFVSLAEQHYFDATKCHRLVPGFVLQCGDPTATGTGGPGYSFADELSGNEKYTRGTVAMANAGPNTNGSQFFIMLADAPSLPPSYDVLGTVSAASMSVVDAIAAKDGDTSGNSQTPLHPINVTSITVG